MRAETVVRVTTACGLALAMAAPALAQDVRVQVKIDPAVVQEIKDIIRDASRSDMGREIGDAVRDAVRETTRALPEVSALMPSGGWQDRNFRAEQKDSQTKTAAIGANGSLDLKNVSGDVIVNAGGGRDATIEIVRVSHGRTDADAKTGLDRVHVDVTTRSDRTTVEAVYPSENRPPYSVSINYTVTAPAGTRVNVSSVSGDVSVKGITGDVAVSVISGGIRLDNANVSSATTISGDVTGTHLSTTGAMTISSVSGTTTLTQIKCKRLSASVVSGDVIARDVTCDNAELKNISGDVQYSGALTRGGRYELQTHSGGVKLTVSGSVGFDLQASTFSGQIRLEPPLQLQNASISRRSARGTVGDGGAVVTATAFSGDVVIVKK
jgi:Putative adhesin